MCAYMYINKFTYLYIYMERDIIYIHTYTHSLFFYYLFMNLFFYVSLWSFNLSFALFWACVSVYFSF